MLRPFTVHEPSSVKDAVNLLAEFGSEGRIYAGGTELLLIMKEGLARFRHLVNIKSVPDLDGMEIEDGWLEIGPCVTHRMIEDSNIVKQHYPCLGEMERSIANIRVRNVGTIGGNLCFAEPHSDPATLLLVYDAVVEIAGLNGSRRLPLRDFILGPLETALSDGEILTRIRVPGLPVGMKAAYMRFGYYERPTIGIACSARLSGKDGIQEVRFSAGSVGEKPVRLDALEEFITGKEVGEAISLASKAGEIACGQIRPRSDAYGTEAYKRQLIIVFLRRVFQSACGEA